MNKLAIKVERLGKRYRIGARQKKTRTPRELFQHLIRIPFGYLRSSLREPSEAEIFWALQDVSFEVKQGETLGIIGRNGAGKSTLLKLLSRITEPTEGRAEIYGRVSSLLEVGTGFHPELTGRENIYLNGAILGMKQAEVKRKFDEIVAFAGVDKFLDTPVKRYSSGMYVRLAFAVAAHLETEILLVDEVLAVGDAAFQKKCLGKMGDVVKEGRTVFFVSHNMVAVQSLCTRAIWLEDGRIVEDGQPDIVILNYHKTAASTVTEQVWDDMVTAPGNDMVRLHRARVRPADGSFSDDITMRTPFVIEIEFWNLVPDAYLHITLHLHTEQGITAFSTGSINEPVWHGRPFLTGLFRSVCYVPGDLLNSGIHHIMLLIVKNQGTIAYRHKDVLSFEVLDSAEVRGAWYGKLPGVVYPMLKWTTEYVDNNVPEGVS